MQIGRFDSSTNNSARAMGGSESRGENLGMNYSSDALQISLGKVASMRRRFTDGGTKNVAPRRSNFRKGTSKTNQVRFVTVRLEECCKVILGGLERHVLRSRDAQSRLQKPVTLCINRSFLSTSLILRFIFSAVPEFPNLLESFRGKGARAPVLGGKMCFCLESLVAD